MHIYVQISVQVNTSTEPLTSLFGSCHIPAVCSTVKIQGTGLV